MDKELSLQVVGELEEEQGVFLVYLYNNRVRKQSTGSQSSHLELRTEEPGYEDHDSCTLSHEDSINHMLVYEGHAWLSTLSEVLENTMSTEFMQQQDELGTSCMLCFTDLPSL